MLGSDDIYGRDAAVEALSRIGEPALAALIEALDHPDQQVRYEASRAISVMSADVQKKAVALLVDAIRVQGTYGQRLAAMLLRFIVHDVNDISESRVRREVKSILDQQQGEERVAFAVDKRTRVTAS